MTGFLRVTQKNATSKGTKMKEERVICLECGWEGLEGDTDYHFAKPYQGGDWTTCPECGSEKLMYEDEYDNAQADGEKYHTMTRVIEILADRVLGGEDWADIVKELEIEVLKVVADTACAPTAYEKHEVK